MCKKDERIERLSELNISSSAMRLVRENGYDEIKAMISEGAFEVLARDLKLWFRRCPELRGFSVCWAEEHGAKNISDERLVEALLDQTSVKDFTSIWVYASNFNKEKLGHFKIEMPDFMKLLFEVISNEDQTFKCTEHTMVENCNDYFEEISEFMGYLEE